MQHSRACTLACRSSGRRQPEGSSPGTWDLYGDGSNTSTFAASGARGSRGGAPALPPRHEALSFIRAHSDDPQDLLPGLCLFIEQWLAQVGTLDLSLAQHHPLDSSMATKASEAFMLMWSTVPHVSTWSPQSPVHVQAMPCRTSLWGPPRLFTSGLPSFAD